MHLTNPLDVTLCEHKGVAGRWLSRGEKKIYAPTTTNLDTTSSWDFEGWESCSYLYSIFRRVSSVSRHTITLCSGKRLSFYERAEQFGNLATLAALEAGCHAARWLCWPVTNSNCPHKKLQVAALPPLSAHLQPLTPHPQRGSIRGGISAGDEQICPNFPDLPPTDHQTPNSAI